MNWNLSLWLQLFNLSSPQIIEYRNERNILSSFFVNRELSCIKLFLSNL